MTLPEIAVKRPIATLMALVCVLVLGVIALFRLNLGFMPEAESRSLYVSFSYPNASPKALERMIIKPIEDALSSMNGLTEISSRVSSWGNRVSLDFGYKVDIDLARAEIHERLDRIKSELPEDLDYITISSHRDAQETGETILEARLSSNRDLSQDYNLLEQKVIRPLSRIPGVAQVNLDGVNPKEVRIELDLARLKQYRLQARDIWQSVARNNQNAAIGILRTSKTKVTLRSLGRFTSIEQIRQQLINNSQLKLADVATITYQEPELEFGRHINGDFAVGLNISKESSAKTIGITQAIHKKIEKMKADPELTGIHFLVWQDQGKEIKNTLNDLKNTGIFGAILAFFVLLIFLRRLSTTLVAVLCIPFSLIVACGVIWVQGKTMNTISLLGLIVGIGMLVDNAVVIMENINRYQNKGYSGRVAAILGSKEVSVAVITATVTSLIVFLPMIFSKPTDFNIILQELGITIAITLLASLIISQTLIPLASAKLVKQKQKQVSTPIMDKIRRHYVKVLSFNLKHRWLAIFSGAVILASTYYPVKNMNFNFERSSTQSFVGMSVQAFEANSLVAKENIISQIEKILMPHKERLNVDAIYSWWDENYSIIRLYMKTGFQNEEAMNKVRKVLPSLLPEIAGVEIQVQDNTPFWRRNAGKKVAVELQGNDSDILAKIAKQAMNKIETIPGLFDIYSTSEGDKYELHVELDRDRMAAYQISASEPANLLEMTFRERRISRYKTQDGEVDIKLLLNQQQNTSLADVKNSQLIKENEQPILLNNISQFYTEKIPRGIRRNGKITNIYIGARFDSGKKNEYREKVTQLLKEIELPNGYQWGFNFSSKREKQNQTEFITSLLLSLGLIFAVMAGLFESMRQALSLMISLPFALAGAFWTLFIFGIDFDQPASVALLLLLGIVVNNGIVMIEHINLYRRQGWKRYDAMIQGGQERLRPIIMTALTTLVGLIPIIIQKPSLGGTYYYSMAYVIIGGLLFSTLLTTLFLPATISLVEDVSDRFRRVLS